jgi:hypothetical protein
MQNGTDIFMNNKFLIKFSYNYFGCLNPQIMPVCSFLQVQMLFFLAAWAEKNKLAKK